MVHYMSLFVALAAVSTVAASPRKAIASSVLSKTVVSEETTSTSVTDTSAADSTSTYVEDPTTTSPSETETLTVDETTTTTASTTTDDLTTTSAAVPVCGVTGYFVSGQPAMTYLTSPGNKASAKECLEGCATWTRCELIAFYETGSSMGTCEYFQGKILTEGSVTVYKWYDLRCLASM